MNPSTAQASVLVDELVRNTVSHAVVCPGSRNAPLLLALHRAAAAEELTLHVRIDERSAGFLALGIAARTGRPVVLACTSGTAAANFHPAVLEADRAGIPLLVCTADRPPELRAAGANQVVDQRKLYGDAVRYYDEFAVAARTPGQNAYWRSQICRAWYAARGDWRGGPVQLNVPLRDPLLPDDGTAWCESLAGRPGGARWTETVATAAAPSHVVPDARRGLVIVGDSGVAAASEWAERHGWPVISETGGCGLGGSAAIVNGVWLLGVADFVAAHKPEQVLCIGRPTVFRQVGGLLADPEVDVLLVRPGVDWPAPAHNVRQVGQWFAEPVKPAAPEWLATWQRADAAVSATVRGELARVARPNGPAVAGEVVDALPDGALLVVGSSNPTRDVALAGRARPDVAVHRNRGVAGIDGTVSTAVGAASVHQGPAYALLGDLTFLHDVNGLLSVSYESLPDLTIVVLNDNGGGIFSLLEQGDPAHADGFERVFGTPHNADIGALCRGYGVPHSRVDSLGELREALWAGSGPRVLEVVVDRADHRALHRDAAAAVSRALLE